VNFPETCNLFKMGAWSGRVSVYDQSVYPHVCLGGHTHFLIIFETNDGFSCRPPIIINLWDMRFVPLASSLLSLTKRLAFSKRSSKYDNGTVRSAPFNNMSVSIQTTPSRYGTRANGIQAVVSSFTRSPCNNFSQTNWLCYQQCQSVRKRERKTNK